jgi:DMSO/TMAO reductase YedYZ molybdopterin-dependent catalytic subunit
VKPTNRIRIPLGAAAGLLSAAAGVGASMIVSVIVGGAPTPSTAVGSRVIDATPGAVKDWAVNHLGTNDKPFLLTGIFSAIAVLAALTGVVAWRSRRLALALTAALGLVGLAAAYADRTTLVGSLAKIGPAVVALAVSVGFLFLFTRRWNDAESAAPEDADESAELVAVGTGSTARSAVAGRGGATSTTLSEPEFRRTPTARPKASSRAENSAPAGFDRRAFIAAALASGAVAAVGLGSTRVFGNAGARSRSDIALPKAADAAPALTGAMTLDGVKGLTPYLTPNSDFYRVDTALSVPQIDAGNWSMKIHGLVDHEIELSFADLVSMPLIERRVTLSCVSNEVGGHYAGNALWLGVKVSDLLERAGVQSGADAVKSTSVDGMTIGTPLQALTDDREAMIAIGMNGDPLPLAHGFPARMVVPGLYGYVSATKWLVDLEVTRFADFSAYWTSRGFSAQAPIKTFSRIDVPASFASLKPGKNAVAGVAWAQNTGIEKVEVRIDGGSWQPARLPREDTIDSWRQWVYEWDADSGSHLLEVRATDHSGYTQTSRRAAPRPDGATGWHSVNVTVA